MFVASRDIARTLFSLSFIAEKHERMLDTPNNIN
jgi:hypothetical protein